MKLDVDKVLKITKELLDVPSCINYEKPFLDYLNINAKNFGFETIQTKDYLIVKPKNIQTKKIFSVHIDRHGVIKNKNGDLEHLGFNLKKEFNLPFKRDEIEKFEFELFDLLKEKFPDFTLNLTDDLLRFKNNKFDLKFNRIQNADFYKQIADRYVGEKIISYDEKTKQKLNEYKIRRYDLEVKKRLIKFMINEKLKKEDEIFMLKPQLLIKDDLFYGQIDNVISVACLFYLMKEQKFNQEIIFTTKEEIGASFECVIDYLKDKKNLNLIVLDTSPYPDFEDKDKGFITLRYGDERNGFDVKLTEEIKELLEGNNIPYDFKPSFIGTTELGQIAIKSKNKINGTSLQLPSLNYHSNYETSTLKSLENYVKVIEELSK